MLLLRFFLLARRRFGFMRALLFFFAAVVVAMFALFFTAKAFGAPPTAGVGTPPMNPLYNKGLSYRAFDGTPAWVCTTDHSVCPGQIELRSRLLNKPSRYNVPVEVQLALNFEAWQCEEVTCRGTLLPTPDHRKLAFFIDGHLSGYVGVWWMRVSSSTAYNADRTPASSSTQFVSAPYLLGFNCGWHTLTYGIFGDAWNGTEGADGFGNATHYGPAKATWALSVPLPVFAGECVKPRSRK
jgi:hypothetical protein